MTARFKLKAFVPTEMSDMLEVWTWSQIAAAHTFKHAGKGEADRYIGPYPELEFLVASPTGLKMTIGTAVKAKRAGMLPKGYPDWHLPVPMGMRGIDDPKPRTDYPCFHFHALFIEEKRRSLGRYSPDQIRWFDFLVAQGNAVAGCRGATETINTIVSYLEGKFVQRASLGG